MWIDDHLQAAASHCFPHVAGMADALNAAQANVGACKKRVAEFQQCEQAEREGKQREEISQHKQHGTDDAQAFAKRRYQKWIENVCHTESKQEKRTASRPDLCSAAHD
jgi:hypothetical protein